MLNRVLEIVVDVLLQGKITRPYPLYPLFRHWPIATAILSELHD